MITLIILVAAILFMLFGLWQLRMLSWPKVQVRVLSSREEVTGNDDGSATGWLHAELEYWYQKNRYQVSWRADLMEHRHLPLALWMILPPGQPAQPRLPPKLILPVMSFLASLFLFACFTLRFF